MRNGSGAAILIHHLQTRNTGFLYNYIVQYDAVIFTMHDYAKKIEPGNITIITPLSIP